MFLKIPQNLMFLCEFCENVKNTFFAEHVRETASENITLFFITLECVNDVQKFWSLFLSLTGLYNFYLTFHCGRFSWVVKEEVPSLETIHRDSFF